MADLRNTNTIVEVLADRDPQVRSTETQVEVLAARDPSLRSTNTVVEVLYDRPDATKLVRSTNTLVEALVDNGPPFRVTQYQLEVIMTPAPPPDLEELPEHRWEYPFAPWVPVQYGERWGHSE